MHSAVSSESKTPPSARSGAPAATVLERNAFAVLKATLRDGPSRIVGLAEDASLLGDEDACRAAAAEIANPRTRLSAEIAWIPGVSPAKAAALIAAVRRDPSVARTTEGLPALASANLMAMAFELIGPGLTVGHWTDWVVDFGEITESLDAETVFRDLNEERSLSGFPQIPDVSWVETALDVQRRHFKTVVLEAMDRLPSRLLVAILNKVLTQVTAGGHNHAPILIEEICTAYELQATAALDRGAEGILAILEAAREATQKCQNVAPFIKRIDSLTREWDALAQPIQLMMKSRGTEHERSSGLAYAIRSLAIEIVNDHSLVDEGATLTQLLSDAFSELPEVSERVKRDAATLQNLARQRDERKRSEEEWAREITYSVEIGALGKRTFSISPEGVSWKDRRLSLDQITRVRWGATRHSVNGIPTGTTYSVAVGDEQDEIRCEMRQEQAWLAIVDRLWRAVGFRLFVEVVGNLRSGRKWKIGSAIVDDCGVVLPRHAVFGSKDPVYLRWAELQIWTSDGSFYIGSSADRKVYAEFPYLTCDNAHVLERALRQFWKSATPRLSDLLES
jgi:hypothetical protein